MMSTRRSLNVWRDIQSTVQVEGVDTSYLCEYVGQFLTLVVVKPVICNELLIPLSRCRVTHSPRTILPNPYHSPPLPTSPDNFTLLGSALSAFLTRWLKGCGIVQSA